MKFIKMAGQPNELLDDDENCYVSYNETPWCGFSLLESDGKKAETALYLRGKWLILNGDFRREYEEVYPDPDKCLALYNKHKASARSSWSTG